MATSKRRAAGKAGISARAGGGGSTAASKKRSDRQQVSGREPRSGIGSAARSMRPSISFVSLPVRDVAISRRFYEALGLVASDRSRDGFALFQMNGVVLALATRTSIVKELGFRPGRGGGVILSHNVESTAAVVETLEVARRAGARILRRPAPASWGGLIGCFADPDGHVWEVVFNPGLPMDAAGNALLDPPGVW
jgi:predicted lactoylglutathione lyase